MISHLEIQTVLRAHLASLAVCATGLTTLSATATGYARTAGSFLDDGFRAGMEVVPTGFASTPVDTITSVTALAIATASAHPVERAGANRSLDVGLPSRVLLENEALVPDVRAPYAEEQYTPGPARQISAGRSATINGFLVAEPLYSPHIAVPRDTGIEASGAYADALLDLFRASTTWTLANGDQLRVRSDAAPMAGQRMKNAAGTHALVPLSIWLRVYTANRA